MPATLGVAGYVAPIVVITAGYALFQTANNTAVMTDVAPDQRGVVSGMLNLSRNLGLDHRRIRHGRGVRARVGDGRHHDGAARGRRHRHADHVRGRGGADRRGARDRDRRSRNGTDDTLGREVIRAPKRSPFFCQ